MNQLEKCWLDKLLHQEDVNASTKMYAGEMLLNETDV